MAKVAQAEVLSTRACLPPTFSTASGSVSGTVRSKLDTLQRKWQDHFSFANLPKTEGRRPSKESGAAFQGSIENLAFMTVQLEVLAEELINATKAAGMDVMELCRQIKEEVFSSAVVMSSSTNTRGMTTYANKHVNEDPTRMYTMGDEVGAGAFGSVRKAKHRLTGQHHAVKIIPKAQALLAGVWAEIDIIKQLDHPHIMRMYNTFEDELNLYMATELCSGGPFFDTLQQAGYLVELVACKIFRQVVGVVSYLHSRSICHRDIKPENFLVLRNSSVDTIHLKLIDFGTAKRFDILPMVTKVCTPSYVAPEVLCAKNVPYTSKVDMWSCGVILFVMLCGRLPFEGNSSLELMKKVRKGNFQFEPAGLWRGVSENAHDIIRRILCVAVPDRCTADEAFHHPWCALREDEGREGSNWMSNHMMAQIHRFHTNNRLKRVALRIIARQIDDDAIQSQRNVWLYLDNDNSGTITRSEVAEAVMRLDVSDTTRAGMVEIMCQLDPTGCGNVEYTEFLAASMDKKQYMQEEVCRAAFVRLDFDGDGIVTRRDLGRLLSDKDGMRDAGLTGASLSELIGELETIMADADANGDGGVSFEEFMELMDEDGPLPSRTALNIRMQRPSHANYGVELKQLWATELAGMHADNSDDDTDGV